MNRVRVIPWIFGAIAFVVGYGIYEEQQDARQVCERGNENREAILDGFDFFTDALIASTDDTPRTPDEEEARQLRIDAFRADLDERLAPLAPRPCS